MNSYCDMCQEYYSDQWVLKLSDDKERLELNGHEKCVDDLIKRIKAVKDLEKKSLQKVLKEIGITKEVNS